jgi:hypothetical protein
VSVLDIEVEDGRDPRMGEAGQDPRLAAEAFARGGVAQGAAEEHLDGDDSIEVGVVGLPDLAHAAFTEGFEEAVAA